MQEREHAAVVAAGADLALQSQRGKPLRHVVKAALRVVFIPSLENDAYGPIL
jgi:hypothetical protein